MNNANFSIVFVPCAQFDLSYLCYTTKYLFINFYVTSHEIGVKFFTRKCTKISNSQNKNSSLNHRDFSLIEHGIKRVSSSFFVIRIFNIPLIEYPNK